MKHLPTVDFYFSEETLKTLASQDIFVVGMQFAPDMTSLMPMANGEVNFLVSVHDEGITLNHEEVLALAECKQGDKEEEPAQPTNLAHKLLSIALDDFKQQRKDTLRDKAHCDQNLRGRINYLEGMAQGLDKSIYTVGILLRGLEAMNNES